MGTWGTAILSNDTAADVAADFKDSIAFGKSIEEAEDQLIADFGIDSEEDPYALCPFWLGLAYKQAQMGRLSERTKANALRIIDEGIDIAIWEAESPQDVKKRQAALDKLRKQITGPQKKPTKVRKPFVDNIEWEEGDGLAYQLPSGKWTALHVLKIRRNKRSQIAFYVVLDVLQDETPTEADLLSANLRLAYGVCQGLDKNDAYAAELLTPLDWRTNPNQTSTNQTTFTQYQYMQIVNDSGFWQSRRSSRDNPPRPFTKITNKLPALPHDILGVYYPYDWRELDTHLQLSYGLK
ncbi:MAG: hypothetical protein ACX94C_14320 [Phycisphaerales bacterium]